MPGWLERRGRAMQERMFCWVDRRLEARGASPRAKRPSPEPATEPYDFPWRYATPAALQNAEQRADRGVVLAAVQQHAGHLRHASKELRADREVVMAAVTKGGSAIRYASAALHSQSVSLSINFR